MHHSGNKRQRTLNRAPAVDAEIQVMALEEYLVPGYVTGHLCFQIRLAVSTPVCGREPMALLYSAAALTVLGGQSY